MEDLIESTHSLQFGQTVEITRASEQTNENVATIDTHSEQLTLERITASNAATPLLRLSAEIRNKIYTYVLGGHIITVAWIGRTKRRMVSFRNADDHIVNPIKDIFPLLSVCSQIYGETALYPFSQNTFVSKFPDEFEKWTLMKLRERQRVAITTFRCPFDEAYFKLDPRGHGKVVFNFDVFPGVYCIILCDANTYHESDQDRWTEEFRAASGKSNLVVLFPSTNAS